MTDDFFLNDPEFDPTEYNKGFAARKERQAPPDDASPDFMEGWHDAGDATMSPIAKN